MWRNNPNIPPSLRTFFEQAEAKSRAAPAPNPEPKNPKAGKPPVANDESDNEDELTFEYIVSKKPKAKVVKEYLKKFLNSLYAEDD